MKPIDGDALIAAIEQMMKYQIDADDICEMIQNFQPIEPERKEGYQLPSAQPEIIRCKDCKHVRKWRSEESAKKFGQVYECARGVLSCPKSDDFCSKAERRER